jgi:hypothetical protein
MFYSGDRTRVSWVESAHSSTELLKSYMQNHSNKQYKKHRPLAVRISQEKGLLRGVNLVPVT